MPILLNNLWIIPLLPLAGAAINGLLGKQWPQSRVNAVGLSSVSLAFLAVIELVREFLALPAAQIPWVRSYAPWMVAGKFRADFNFQVDQLTIVMLGVITGVGLLIHIYSTGYMAHEGGYYRFFTYLNLFMFFMLTLVMAGNLVLMFVGWEGVGLCSYLLIGFYFLRKSAADAGKKAFIVTRIGDVGFMIGTLLVFWTFELGRFYGDFQASERHARRERHLYRRHAHGDLPAAIRRRHRQIRAIAALRLAAGRDGRPDAGERVDPCGHDGHSGRVHGRAHARALLARAAGDAGGGHRRRGHRVLFRDDRAGADRHQESARLFHRLAARVHVSWLRRGRLRGGHLPSDDSRVFQRACSFSRLAA